MSRTGNFNKMKANDTEVIDDEHGFTVFAYFYCHFFYHLYYHENFIMLDNAFSIINFYIKLCEHCEAFSTDYKL